MGHWIESSNIYHIYPLGFCGCERFSKDAAKTDGGKILKVIEWIPHLLSMNMNAVYFGPVFESEEHGYDTNDYFSIDRRLGSNEDFKKVCQKLHENGIRVILDGVFNHVGRGHGAFLDLKEKGYSSEYRDWFSNVDFGRGSPLGDSFSYEGWQGHYNLVKLNLYNKNVVDYLFSAVKMWIDEWDIDGIRFDAADCLCEDFIRQIHIFAKSIKPDIWLMGEIIHGSYGRWANSSMFDSVTNYQCHKGMYSSLNDGNFFEIAHNIEYQISQSGNLYLYNFLDNHDVPRIASALKNPAHLECCYTLMYMLYGVPSVYYGSEFGIKGQKASGAEADIPLRPCLDFDSIPDKNEKLLKHISKLSKIRAETKALQSGKYSKVDLKNRSFMFKRELNEETAYIGLNISGGTHIFTVSASSPSLLDKLSGEKYPVKNGVAEIAVNDNGSVILVACAENVSENAVSEIQSPQSAENAAEIKEPAAAYSSGPSKNAGISGVGITSGRTIKIGGHYRHFKGGEYVVLNVARDHETFEETAVYMQLNGKPIVWARPLKMFLENVDDHGNIKERFTLIED